MSEAARGARSMRQSLLARPHQPKLLADALAERKGEDPALRQVTLRLYPRNKPSASLHETLGLTTVATPTGIALKTDERRETSTPGIYAAGDLANPAIPSVTTAIWQGAMAGIFAQQSMLV